MTHDLIDPQQALDTISRDELVNLLVDDALTRAQAEQTRLNLLCNTAGEEAGRLLLQVYAAARHQALLDLAPTLKALRGLVKTAGYAAPVSISHLPEARQLSMLGGWQVYDKDDARSHRNDHNTPRLCKLITALAGHHVAPGMVEAPKNHDFLVDLQACSTETSHLNVFVSVKLTLKDLPDLRDWAAAHQKEQNYRQQYATLSNAVKDPTELSRKALASLTREALRKKGVVLEGGLPVAPLQLPG